MRLVLFGAPGSGKGTQGPLLAEHFDIPQISTGEIFRDHMRRGTDLGVVAEGYMSIGELVPDEITTRMVVERLTQPDAQRGFVLDGYPRTLPQARALDQWLAAQEQALTAVIYLLVSQEVLEDRLGGRWTCSCCGRVYSKVVAPRKPGVCDDDGTDLVQREDDKPEAVRRRIEVYLEQTMPVLDYYRTQGKVLEIDGTRSVEAIKDEVIQRLGGGEVPPFEAEPSLEAELK